MNFILLLVVCLIIIPGIIVTMKREDTKFDKIFYLSILKNGFTWFLKAFDYIKTYFKSFKKSKL